MPSISYSSVEGIFLDLVSASPMWRAAKDIGRRFNETIEGIKVTQIFLQGDMYRCIAGIAAAVSQLCNIASQDLDVCIECGHGVLSGHLDVPQQMRLQKGS